MNGKNDTGKHILASIKSSRLVILSFCFVALLLFLTVGSLLYFRELTANNAKGFAGEKYEKYDNYYVMITNNRKSQFWSNVYEGAKASLKENSYLEMYGNSLSVEYSSVDLMRIAIASKVDGIILEADESAEMTALINKANDAGIPVITALGDNSASKRKSFVGVNSYKLGLSYGEQVCEIEKKNNGANVSGEAKVLVLMNTNTNDTSQNIILSGISDAIKKGKNKRKISVETVAISNNGAFAAEESIRDIFMNPENIPDTIICMNELDTTCVYQEVVDYNKVGKVNIIGYYGSDTILKGIERGVINSTISVGTRQMGMYCANALEEYRKTKHVSEFFSVDFSLINSDNVSGYLGDANEATNK